MFLLHNPFQQMSGVIERLHSVSSRAASLLSDNQPSLLQNTPFVRHTSEVIGKFLSFTWNSELSTRNCFPANLVARLAASRHKTPISATHPAHSSRVVAAACHSANAAATTKSKPVFRFAFVFTHHSYLVTHYFLFTLKDNDDRPTN